MKLLGYDAKRYARCVRVCRAVAVCGFMRVCARCVRVCRAVAVCGFMRVCVRVCARCVRVCARCAMRTCTYPRLRRSARPRKRGGGGYVHIRSYVRPAGRTYESISRAYSSLISAMAVRPRRGGRILAFWLALSRVSPCGLAPRRLALSCGLAYCPC